MAGLRLSSTLGFTRNSRLEFLVSKSAAPAVTCEPFQSARYPDAGTAGPDA